MSAFICRNNVYINWFSKSLHSHLPILNIQHSSQHIEIILHKSFRTISFSSSISREKVEEEYSFDRETKVYSFSEKNLHFKGFVHDNWTPPTQIPLGGYITTLGMKAVDHLFPDKKPSVVSTRFVARAM